MPLLVTLLLTWAQAHLTVPLPCWQCGAETPADGDDEHCPACGADRVPF